LRFPTGFGTDVFHGLCPVDFAPDGEKNNIFRPQEFHQPLPVLLGFKVDAGGFFP